MICVLCNLTEHSCTSCGFSDEEYFHLQELNVCSYCYPKECGELFKKYYEEQEALETQMHDRCKEVIAKLKIEMREGWMCAKCSRIWGPLIMECKVCNDKIPKCDP